MVGNNTIITLPSEESIEIPKAPLRYPDVLGDQGYGITQRKTALVLGIWNRRSIPKKIRETTSKRETKCLV
jgi:hypothetical protein